MRHADILDIAQQRQQEEIQRAISNRKIYKGTSSLYCVECGERIPDDRRKAVPGCCLCVDCQQIRDKRHLGA